MGKPIDKQRPIDRALERAKVKFGWNQVQFAKELSEFGREVVPQDITNWKTRGMPPEHHEAVARLLRWSVDELLGMTSAAVPNMVKDEPRSASQIGSLTLAEARLIDVYRQATPEKRQVFDILVKAELDVQNQIAKAYESATASKVLADELRGSHSSRVRKLLEDRAQLEREGRATGGTVKTSTPPKRAPKYRQ